MRILYLFFGGCIVLLSRGLGALHLFLTTLAVILVFKWINKPERVFTVPDRTSEFSVAFSNIAKQGYTGYSGHAGCISERGLSDSSCVHGPSGVPRIRNMIDGGQADSL